MFYYFQAVWQKIIKHIEKVVKSFTFHVLLFSPEHGASSLLKDTLDIRGGSTRHNSTRGPEVSQCTNPTHILGSPVLSIPVSWPRGQNLSTPLAIDRD